MFCVIVVAVVVVDDDDVVAGGGGGVPVASGGSVPVVVPVPFLVTHFVQVTGHEKIQRPKIMSS
jgi:hypothetical protein